MLSSKFVSYSDIENSYREKTINEIVSLGFSDGLWSVTEKVHGANASIWIERYKDCWKLSFASRNNFIEEGAKFYCYEKVLAKLKEPIDAITELVFSDPAVQLLTIYGELFGGDYRHPNVAASGESRVQKGVQYHPEQCFLAFDIKLDGHYVNTPTFNQVCSDTSFPFLKPLFVGSFWDCLSYDINFQSTVPSIYGLPPVEDNLCEGVVIKPHEPKFFHTGARVILKKKNEKFSEKVHKERKERVQKEVDPAVESEIDHIQDYINDNRLDAVLSKLGEVTIKDFGKVAKALSEDVMKDYLKDWNELYFKLEKNQQKEVSKFLGKATAELIRPALQQR